ncbi:hypothetical protein GLOTRDRAFT_111085 [Gloeophyllum trabeum ATCC 11539]|uniref:Uncharacterized protein n=1 Tax=Gloeophyllum trabeum (strain ATCC 11539 / FP-39264 / Madison 617) TaxID=670483 RepID=S7Q974_GLOTA|nr:uncharacterized protein GLOTRDRAFT_111085 [Gloeophyllum trabeum ATCC 11539]EPQ56057.1 hypothetical protein GLOTRDRAFT_111085 [Gloeophyllum trabeum ATCC 11539]
MNVFNPKILDASIRDVTASLTDDQKADVLLYAMKHLQVENSRTTIENAVQSILQIADLSPRNAASARVLRAKARLAAGRRVGAHEDLEAVLRLEPDHPEASILLSRRVVVTDKSPVHPRSYPMFSVEIWREIALFLPRHDLKTLLLVPHIVSRVASQLLFQKIDLHFVVWEDDEDESQPEVRLDQQLDKWHAQRSADILTRIIIDPGFASLIKTMRIFAPRLSVQQSMAFQTGMLSNALPKMNNLTNFHCTMNPQGLNAVMRVIESSRPKLSGLSLKPTNRSTPIILPNLKSLRKLAVYDLDENASQTFKFIAHNQGTIRELSLKGLFSTLSTEALAVRHLTQLDFSGTIRADRQVFSEILANGRQLEALRISCILNTAVSAQFRSNKTALPYLKHFAFSIMNISAAVTDTDLFPALSEFLRNRKALVTLHLKAPFKSMQQRLGYDAAVWGVLPSLPSLRNVHITIPKDVAPGLATWLIPREVTTLSLDGELPELAEMPSFISQLRPGVPPGLKLVAFPQYAIPDVALLIERGFPMVRVCRLGDDFWTVIRKEDGVSIKELERWPSRRARYSAPEWLEWLGCEDALWPEIIDFL